MEPSHSKLRLQYTLAASLAVILVAVAAWQFEASGRGRPDVPARDDVNPGLARPLIRDEEFYGINTGIQDLFRDSVSMSGIAVDASGHIAFEAKVRITETASSSASAGIAYYGESGERLYTFIIVPNDGRLRLYDSRAKKYIVNMYARDDFRARRWYTLKIVIDGGALHAFVDGVEVTQPPGVPAAAGAGRFGLRTRQGIAEFDDCRLYDPQSGATEFMDDFTGGAIGWEESNSGIWSVEAQDGGSVYRADVLVDAERMSEPELSPEFNRNFDLLEASGARHVRVFFDWNDIQPSGPESFYWEYMDALVIAAHAHNMALLPDLVYSPAWAVAPENRSSEASYSFPPINQADYSRFAEAAVRRYMPDGELAREQGWTDGYGATSFEIGNEYNISRVIKEDGSLFFAGWMGDINDYVDLLKAGHDAVKSSCSACMVLNGAPGDGMMNEYSRRRDPTGVRQYLWQGVEDLYEAIQLRHPGDPNAADRYFDILNIHTYEWFMFTAQGKYPDLYRAYEYPDPMWYRDRLGNVVEVMSRYGDSDKDIWLTETTYPSSDDRDPNAGYLGEQGQADALRMIYRESAAFPQVKKVFWWYSNDLVVSVGLIRKDMTTKPSYDAYRELTGRRSQGGP